MSEPSMWSDGLPGTQKDGSEAAQAIPNEGLLTRRLGAQTETRRLSARSGMAAKAAKKKTGQRQGLVEYGMIMSLLAIICFLIVTLMGRIVGRVLNQVLLQIK